MYEGSMYGAGLAVFAVWGFVISHARDSRIELNPKKLADTLGGTVEDINRAIEYLSRPDPQSRHRDHEGRRLVQDGQFQYFLPSWSDYQRIRNEDDRREYNRVKQQEYRQKEKDRRDRRRHRGGVAQSAAENLSDKLTREGKFGDAARVMELDEKLREAPLTP